jgi:hypothetical protein
MAKQKKGKAKGKAPAPKGKAPAPKGKALLAKKILRIVTPAGPNDRHKGIEAFENELLQVLGWRGEIDYQDPNWADGAANLAGAVAAAMSDHPDVVVADGSMAAELLRDIQPHTTPIIQAVGGKNPANPYGNLTGFYIDALTTCGAQLNTLIGNLVGVNQKVTVLFDSKNTPSQEIQTELAKAANFPQAKIDFVDTAALPLGFPTDYTTLKNAFMLIPNAVFYNNCQMIARVVEKRNIPARYPEREYKKAHKNKGNVTVQGHHIPLTFRLAAHLADRILRGVLTIDTPLPVIQLAEPDVH